MNYSFAQSYSYCEHTRLAGFRMEKFKFRPTKIAICQQITCKLSYQKYFVRVSSECYFKATVKHSYKKNENYWSYIVHFEKKCLEKNLFEVRFSILIKRLSFSQQRTISREKHVLLCSNILSYSLSTTIFRYKNLLPCLSKTNMHVLQCRCCEIKDRTTRKYIILQHNS